MHCRSRKEAEELCAAIGERLGECGLQLNAQKTKVVYCKDDDRRGTHEHEKFTFLGYEFRPWRTWRGCLMRSFGDGSSITGDIIARSMLYPVFRHLDRLLVWWACRKYKRLRRHQRRAAQWLQRISLREPRLWAHWAIGVRACDGLVPEWESDESRGSDILTSASSPFGIEESS